MAIDQLGGRGEVGFGVASLLLHGEGASPRPVPLGLVLIRMIWRILGIDVGLSIVEIVGSCHSRQSDGDSRRSGCEASGRVSCVFCSSVPVEEVLSTCDVFSEAAEERSARSYGGRARGKW